MHSEICPVCKGKGKVPGGFYDNTGETWTSSISEELCRTCYGCGYILVPDNQGWWNPTTERIEFNNEKSGEH